VPPVAAYRQANAAAREVERARKAYERSEAASEKEKRRLYQDSRAAEATLENEELQARVSRLGTILAETLAVEDHIDFEALKDQPQAPPFDADGLDVPEPPLLIETFLPPEPKGPARYLPGSAKRHEAAIAEGTARYEASFADREAREAHRAKALEAARAAYAAHIDELRAASAPQHTDIDTKHRDCPRFG
jgi:restriction system protein